jgi:hypothetical protein
MFEFIGSGVQRFSVIAAGEPPGLKPDEFAGPGGSAEAVLF